MRLRGNQSSRESSCESAHGTAHAPRVYMLGAWSSLVRGALVAAALPGLASAAPLRLREFVGQVLAANPQVRAAAERAAARSHRVAPAGAPEDPFFAAGPDAIPLSGGAPGVVRFQLSQSIPFPGKLSARRNSAA